MIHFLQEGQLWFPSVDCADESGILAIGAKLSTERLLLAYDNGIFPWFNQDDPIIWWAPSKRMVLFLDELRVSKSMRKILNKKQFEVTLNTCFDKVISHCQKVDRPGQDGTWITNEIVEAYKELHRLGKALSVEVWLEGELVGGLYGVDCSDVFCGESMFSLTSNASKVAFIFLVEYLKQRNYKLLDCQVYNPHLESLGAREIPREEFMKILHNRS